MEIYADNILPNETDVVVHVHFVDDTDDHLPQPQGDFTVLFEKDEAISLTIGEIHKKAIYKAWQFLDKCLGFRNV